MVSRMLKIHTVLRILCVVLLPAALISLSGCGSSIRLARAIHHSGEDWLVFGRDGQHTNRASTVLNPPLKLLWAYDASAGFGSGSPIVVDSVVFIGTLTGELHAVELATGKRIGYTSLGSALVGAPAISNGRIVVACAMGDEPLVAFDLHYGDRLWKKNITSVETSPVTYGDKIFLAALDGVLYCLNKYSGNEIWRFETKRSIHSSPATDGTMVVFGCDDGFLYAVDVDSGKQVWQFRTGASIFASPSISNGKAYCGSHDGFFYAINLSDGSLGWKYHVGAKVYAAPAISDSLVFFGSTNGFLYALDIFSGALRWSFRAKSVINSAAVVSGDKIYFGSLDRNIYALNARTGEVLWKHEMEGRMKTSPVIWGRYLLVPSEDRNLYAFGPISQENESH